jgi:hemolysin activation/secretion protein
MPRSTHSANTNKQHRLRPARAAKLGVTKLVGLSLLPVSTLAQAQSVAPASPQSQINSGTLLQQNQPWLAPTAPTKPRPSTSDEDERSSAQAAQSHGSTEQTLFVKRFVLDGDLPESVMADVRKLFAQAEGQHLSVADIVAMRAALNTLLRHEVDLLSYATLPSQKADDGIVHFTLQHGRIADVAFNNTSLLSDKTVKRYFAAAGHGAEPGIPQVELASRRIGTLPGVSEVKPVLAPGKDLGTTDLNLQVTPAPRVKTALIADNAGQRSSGMNRVGAQVAVNSPLGIGDQLQAVALYAPPFAQPSDAKGGRTALGLVSYELPLGYSGVRGGAQYSRVSYRAGGADRDVLEQHGTADVVGLYVNKPLVDRHDANLTVGGTLDYKKLDDAFFGADSKRSSIVGGIRASGYTLGQWFGQPNVLQFDAALHAGHLRQSQFGVLDPGGPLFPELKPLAGRFTTFNGSAQFTQRLGKSLTASLKGSVQAASRHLDSSEQMTLYGAQNVRGYETLSSVDHGAVVQAELAKQISAVPGLSASAFYDVGRGQINKSAAGTGNVFTAQSVGIGLTYHVGSNILIGTSYAKGVGAPPDGQSNVTRRKILLNMTMTF